MKIKKQTRIIFIRASSGPSKLYQLGVAIQYHFSQKEKILISTQDEVASSYLDKWLWEMPNPSSFFPHQICSAPCQVPIAITSTEENLNQASILINLRAKVHPLFPRFSVVYELKDISNDKRYLEAQSRLKVYQAGGYPIIEQELFEK